MQKFASHLPALFHIAFNLPAKFYPSSQPAPKVPMNTVWSMSDRMCSGKSCSFSASSEKCFSTAARRTCHPGSSVTTRWIKHQQTGEIGPKWSIWMCPQVRGRKVPSVGRYLTSKMKRKLISSTKIPWMEGTTNHDAKVGNEKFSDQHQDLSSKKSAIKPIKKGFDPQKKLIALQKPGRFTNPPIPMGPIPNRPRW